MCDIYPDCKDFSDLNLFHRCESPVSLCEQVNATHCACDRDELMCRTNGMCLNKKSFCDGEQDCEDGTDEPPNCNSCRVFLETLEPRKVCNGNVDCGSKHDLGEDESAEACCDVATLNINETAHQFPYRYRTCCT